MKKLLFLILLVFNFSFSQEEIVQQGNAVSKDTVYFAIIKYDKNTAYLIDFGDGNNRFIDKNNLGSPYTIKHIYSKEGNYAVSISKFNNDATKTLLNTINFDVEKPRTKLKITKITFSGYNPVKSDGRAWDNVMGGIFPDVYISLTTLDGVTPIYGRSEIKYDVKAKTDVSWSFEKTFIEGEHLDKGFQVLFYDYDSATAHDFICGISFENPRGNFKNKEGVIKITDIEKYNCAFSIEYIWD